MKTDAIVYASMTGFTAQYANMLSEKTGIPAFTLQEAAEKLDGQANIFFMSWLMAGRLVDYRKAAERFSVLGACSVGLNATPEQVQATRKSTKIPDGVPLFALQGGYAPEKLGGMYKAVMKIVTKLLIKKISAIPDKGEAEEKLIDVMQNGGSFVKEENLADVIAHLKD